MRKLWLLAIIIAGAGVCWFAWTCWLSGLFRPPVVVNSDTAITPENYGRIRLGMTEAEVRALIGLPPGTHQTREPAGGLMSSGNYGTIREQEGYPKVVLIGAFTTVKADSKGLVSETTQDGRAVCTIKQWWGTYHAIRVTLDENNVVVGKHLVEIPWY